MSNGKRERNSVYEWYLPDLELDSFVEKKADEKEDLYIKENKRRIFMQWNEDAYGDLEKNLEYGSLLLRFFMDNLETDNQRALFELGTLKGVVESFEHLLYKKGEELRLQKARYAFFSAVKHLDDVVFALETHGSMTQTELCKYMRNMNASTLSEAMKKILKTGLVTKTALGKYRVYTLTDTGLEYGKIVRKGKKQFDLPDVLKLLQNMIKHTPEGKERNDLQKKIAAVFLDVKNVPDAVKSNTDFVEIKMENKLPLVFTMPDVVNRIYETKYGSGSKHDVEYREKKKHAVTWNLDTVQNTVYPGNDRRCWTSNMGKEPVLCNQAFNNNVNY